MRPVTLIVAMLMNWRLVSKLATCIPTIKASSALFCSSGFDRYHVAASYPMFQIHPWVMLPLQVPTPNLNISNGSVGRTLQTCGIH